MNKKGTKKLPITNGDEEKPVNEKNSYVNEEEFIKIINNLKQSLVKRAIYTIEQDKDEFMDICVEKINDYLKHPKHKTVFKVNTGVTKTSEEGRIVIESKGGPSDVPDDTIHYQVKTDLEIIDDIMYNTMLPRLAIIKILRQAISRDALNNQDILEDITKIISGTIEDQKAKHIKAYKIIDGYEFDWGKIIEADVIDELSENVFISQQDKKKAYYKYYKMDSKGERKFAQNLEDDENVIMFTKLKKGGFAIDTPYGSYTPDWAIIYKSPDSQALKLYFIIETKCDKEYKDLSNVEICKIKCGKMHFSAVDEHIRFSWAKDYNDFKSKENLATI